MSTESEEWEDIDLQESGDTLVMEDADEQAQETVEIDGEVYEVLNEPEHEAGQFCCYHH